MPLKFRFARRRAAETRGERGEMRSGVAGGMRFTFGGMARDGGGGRARARIFSRPRRPYPSLGAPPPDPRAVPTHHPTRLAERCAKSSLSGV
ncbi:hypothetical protein GCM10010251_32000 [Streptomyces aurantiogriseus]|uniref:Uncharacterized protein n=1 Tax=Streptomyces aurantiogriseus TaxID=66870 RepID=A0A918CA34_9ACTN|nr:hypothetical protein GCM10010251_32000 [Streptomyces aurantiogriseus]